VSLTTPSSAKVKNEWNGTSTLLYVFMAWMEAHLGLTQIKVM